MISNEEGKKRIAIPSYTLGEELISSISHGIGALLGIAAYELLFEARARYLYIYAPVFCTAAAAGLEACVGMLSGLWMRRKAHSGTK